MWQQEKLVNHNTSNYLNRNIEDSMEYKISQESKCCNICNEFENYDVCGFPDHLKFLCRKPASTILGAFCCFIMFLIIIILVFVILHFFDQIFGIA